MLVLRNESELVSVHLVSGCVQQVKYIGLTADT